MQRLADSGPEAGSLGDPHHPATRDLISLLEQEFAELALPGQPLAACEGMEGRDLYGAWLGCSQDTEAGITSTNWLAALRPAMARPSCW